MVEISIIIPVYNTARWIPACLESVLAQTERSIEVLCVDDCSSDDSARLIEGYCDKDNRVQLIRLKSRVSTGAVRNAGLDRAAGRFVAFIDSDDLYPNADTLLCLRSSLDNARCDIAAGYVSYFKGDPTTASTDCASIGYSGEKGIVDYLSWQDVRGFCACLYRRSFLEKFHLRFPEITRNEDPVFFLRVMLTAKKFIAVGACTYLYRVGYKTVNWRADGYKLKKEHVQGLIDMLRIARENRLEKLALQMVFELAGAIDDCASFDGLGSLGVTAINEIKTCRFLCAQDKKSVFQWIVCRENKIRRVCFLLRRFGFWQVVFVAFGLIVKRK